MFFLSWSLNDSRSNMRIVWKYVRKTRGFDKNWRKLASELWSVGEQETEYRLMEFVYTTTILDNSRV